MNNIFYDDRKSFVKQLSKIILRNKIFHDKTRQNITTFRYNKLFEEALKKILFLFLF